MCAQLSSPNSILVASWESRARDSIRRNARGLAVLGKQKSPEPSDFQEFLITLFGGLMDCSADVDLATGHEVIIRMLTSGKNAFYDFLWMFFEAIELPAADESQGRLAALIHTLATLAEPMRTESLPGSEEDQATVLSELSTMGSFWDTTPDILNSPDIPGRHWNTRSQCQWAYVNTNRCYAHLSLQQRRAPMSAFRMVDSCGLEAIIRGLEYKHKQMIRDYVSSAAVWLEVAGADIYADPGWGGRDSVERERTHRNLGPLWKEKLAGGIATPNERWDFWLERLREIEASDTLDVELTEAAGRAAHAMQRVAESGKGDP
ncbi:hypothetical protein GGR56DRAFT_659575 [Xylariaceae sp. FL0804]|nr:hypothetical protein GGR56DRAFT_659575 [Xylariaceae sp. FL0804]